jgi:hypothetical protein
MDKNNNLIMKTKTLSSQYSSSKDSQSREDSKTDGVNKIDFEQELFNSGSSAQAETKANLLESVRLENM